MRLTNEGKELSAAPLHDEGFMVVQVACLDDICSRAMHQVFLHLNEAFSVKIGWLDNELHGQVSLVWNIYQ